MNPGKIDHRVRLTRQLIRDALIALMKTHPISRITVKMVVEQAGINRSTFYVHYRDVLDLLDAVQRETLAEISSHISQSAFAGQTHLTVLAMRHMLEYAKRNAELFNALLSENGDSVFQREIMTLAQQKVIHELSTMDHLPPHISEYLQFFVVQGALSIIQKWLSGGLRESTDDMAELCTKLVYQGLSAFSV